MKIRVVGAEAMRADGRTDRQADTTKLIVASLNFANAPISVDDPQQLAIFIR
jgi:hypothetical protein